MTAATVGAFSGLSHAELVAAYQECRARMAEFEEGLDELIGMIEANDGHDALLQVARAILAKESTP